jgi:hypothetical protein
VKVASHLKREKMASGDSSVPDVIRCTISSSLGDWMHLAGAAVFIEQVQECITNTLPNLVDLLIDVDAFRRLPPGIVALSISLSIDEFAFIRK